MTLLRFSTRNIPPAGRKEAVESVLRANSGVVVDFVRGEPIAVEMGMRALPGVQLAGCTASSFKCRNAGTDDSFIVVIGLEGAGMMQHPGRREEIRAGHASLAPLDHFSRSTRNWLAASTMFALAVPFAYAERPTANMSNTPISATAAATS